MHRSRAQIFAALLAFALFLSTALPAFAETAEEAELHRSRAAAARAAAAAERARAAQLEDEAAALDKQVDTLQAAVDQLDPQIDDAETRTQRLLAEVNDLKAKLVQKQADIATTTAEYDRQVNLLGGRMRSSYKQGSWYYLDILLGSKDFGDLIARTELVGRVIESNSEIAIDLDATRDRLERSRAELDRTLQAVAEKKAEAQAVETKLKKLQGRRQSAVNEQEAALRKKGELLAESKANAARLLKVAEAEEAESARIERELSGSGGSGQFHGTMAWPVPGFTRVTSSFGWRTHPVLGGRRHHNGIDIGSNSGRSINGAAIVAAGDGTVIYAGYRGGYGNTVMVDHGDGVVTLYAHQQSGGIKVSNGARVRKGQRIGTVGSTGYSTGAHLHFEVRVNGEPRNPMGYL